MAALIFWRHLSFLRYSLIASAFTLGTWAQTLLTRRKVFLSFAFLALLNRGFSYREQQTGKNRMIAVKSLSFKISVVGCCVLYLLSDPSPIIALPLPCQSVSHSVSPSSCWALTDVMWPWRVKIHATSQVWWRFWSWSLIEILKLKFCREFDA